MTLAVSRWIHPKIRNRIALDYPLDVLFNRQCHLRDYERGALTALRTYNRDLYHWLAEIGGPTPSDLDENIWTEIDKKAQTAMTWHEQAKTRGKARSDFLGEIKDDPLFSRLFVGGDEKLRETLIDSFVAVYQCCQGALGGLELPEDDDDQPAALGLWPRAGSGNILIRGRPGAGKSTLALQIAIASVCRPNHYGAVFLTLDERRQHVVGKAERMGWRGELRMLSYLDDLRESSTPEELGKTLFHLLTQPRTCSMDGDPWELPCGVHNQTRANFPVEPFVLMPRLSPRQIGPNKGEGASLFWERYKQLERLLVAAQWLRRDKTMQLFQVPEIRVVCVDGLNAFGDGLPSRSELTKLFELFKRTGVIGIVTAEAESSQNALAAADAMDYLADIVVNLSMEEDRGYAVRYLEIVKSRYQHEVYGKHFVRLRGPEIYEEHRREWGNAEDVGRALAKLFIRSPDSPSINAALGRLRTLGAVSTDSSSQAASRPAGGASQEKEEGAVHEDSGPDACTVDGLALDVSEHFWWAKCTRLLDSRIQARQKRLGEQFADILSRRGEFHQALMVQPSLHFVVGATERVQPAYAPEKSVGDADGFEMGESGLNQIIKSGLRRGSVVTIRGARGTYKTIIARNFLLHGLCAEPPESALYVTFGESTTFPRPGERAWLKSIDVQGALLKDFAFLRCRSINDPKRKMSVFEYAPDGKASRARFYELALKGGAVLPDELLEFVRDILRQDRNRFAIRRVALDDVALIGASYPFLRESKTAGDLFLSAFVHILRNYGVDLVIAGTAGQLDAGDRMVDRACELADTVLSCAYSDVFGNRYVTVTGEGLAVAGRYERDRKRSKRYFEYAPGVIMAVKGEEHSFEVDLELLKGLVGFGTERVHRPRLSIHMFAQPGSIYNEYKGEIQGLVLGALGSNIELPITGATDRARLEVELSQGSESATYHSPLEALKGKPSERTVVYMLDEFWKSHGWKPEESLADLEPFFGRSASALWKTEDFVVWPLFKKEAAAGQRPDWRAYAVPFYANVLLLAYRKDRFLGLPSGGHVRPSWDQIGKLVVRQDSGMIFDCDLGSQETMSCLLLDCLVAAETDRLRKEYGGRSRLEPLALQEDDERAGAAIFKVFEALRHRKAKSTQHFLNNLCWLGELLGRMRSAEKLSPGALRTDEKGHGGEGSEGKEKDILNKGAAIFACWYSQLRQLIENNDELGSKIGICALPGGGVRGDWYLGVANGSVSLDLGVGAIDVLTRRHEEYNRFAKGVGLPVRREFQKREAAFLAWPHSNAAQGHEVFAIHRAAYSRASIPGYTRFRMMLSIMLDEVTLILKEDRERQVGAGGNAFRVRPEVKEQVWRIVRRIPEQIDLLCKDETDLYPEAPPGTVALADGPR